MFISFREAQKQKTEEHKELIGSPKVFIQPFSGLIDKAIALVQKTNPDALRNISDIRVDLNNPSAFGEFESNHPSTLFINLGKIESEVRAQLSGKSEDEIQKELVNQVSQTLIHESTHQHEYSTSKNTSEYGPELEEKKFREKINQ